MSSFPFPHGTGLSRSSHHTSQQENVTIPPAGPFASNPCLHVLADFQIFNDGSVQDGIKDSGAGLASSVRITFSMSGLLPRAPVVAPSRQRKPSSKKPSNGYPPFHHGPQLSSSATVSHWFRPLKTLTQSNCLSSNRRRQRLYSLVKNLS